MLLPDLSFPQRVSLLVALFTLFAFADWFRNRSNATRYREYLFVAATGALGSLFAVVNDLVTMRISPAYFIDFKGIPEGPDFAAGVLNLAIGAGLFAGIVLGAGLLMANSVGRHPARLTLRQLAPYLLLPLTLAPPTALTVGIFYREFQPQFVIEVAEKYLSSGGLPEFAFVWGVHTGQYAGALAGEVFACLLIVRKRRTP